MRQVFSSQRLENVEGVAALLNEHGIETWISQARSYKGNRRRSFSYSDNAKDKPTPAAVWVVHAEDQPKARALLREAGLMETTRTSYLPEHASAPPPVTRGPVNHAARIRMVMLAAVVCWPPSPARANAIRPAAWHRHRSHRHRCRHPMRILNVTSCRWTRHCADLHHTQG